MAFHSRNNFIITHSLNASLVELHVGYLQRRGGERLEEHGNLSREISPQRIQTLVPVPQCLAGVGSNVKYLYLRAEEQD